jgi:adenosylmethionine-8-amino-7-oxononanoate aminotransferase
MKMENPVEVLDKKYVWHPFTQMQQWLTAPQTVITDADGIRLYDAEGNSYYDGVSSLWVNIHGHKRKEIDEAIKNQLSHAAHTTSLGLASVPAAKLAQMLVNVSPEGLEKLFYSDDGATAVEIALKMAFQYWQIKGKSKKTKFITLKSAYHGDTIGAVSVGGIDLFHQVYQPMLFETYHVSSPSCYHCKLAKQESCHRECLDELENVLKEHADEIGAMIIEPLVQAAAGMLMAPEGYLRRVRELTKKYDVLLIADEVAVGFGRTGKMFACEHEGVSPDFMCISKGITGGYMPLAATLTTMEVFNAFLGTAADKRTFYHGHSYTGNQLGCAAGIASLKIFETDKVLEKMQVKIKVAAKKLTDIAAMEHVGEARQCGLIIGIEIVEDKKMKKPYSWKKAMGGEVCLKAREHGLFIRPVGDVIVFMPPLCSTVEEIEDMLSILKQALHEVTELGQSTGCDGGLF